MEVLEAIHTLRAVREFADTAVEEEKLSAILGAAIMAPSAGNRQPWEFVVIRDLGLKKRLKEVIARGWQGVLRSLPPLPERAMRVYEEATRLVENTEKIPVMVAFCSSPTRSRGASAHQHSSIYPAVQNMLLAAHSLGLGTCLTSHLCSAQRGEEEAKRILRIPPDSKVYALVYLGYPAKKMGKPMRIPSKELTHYDGW